jgi:hypothetical protein
MKEYYRLYPVCYVSDNIYYNAFILGTQGGTDFLPYMILIENTFFEDPTIGWGKFCNNHKTFGQCKYIPAKKFIQHSHAVLSTQKIEIQGVPNVGLYYSEVYVKFSELLLVDPREIKGYIYREWQRGHLLHYNDVIKPRTEHLLAILRQ